MDKTRGGDTADYSWGYGNLLTQVDSDFPDEGTVDYEYDSSVHRRSRDVTGGEYTWYNGNSDEAADTVAPINPGEGDLTRSYYGNADVVGDDPASDDSHRYYMTDILGSTRSVYDKDKNLVASFEYTPFGGSYTESGPNDITIRYTGHDWDDTAQLYYAPYRYYSPDAARWMKRDPLGMIDGPNMYAYVGNNPANYTDPLGLAGFDSISRACTGSTAAYKECLVMGLIRRPPKPVVNPNNPIDDIAKFLGGTMAKFLGRAVADNLDTGLKNIPVNIDFANAVPEVGSNENAGESDDAPPRITPEEIIADPGAHVTPDMTPEDLIPDLDITPGWEVGGLGGRGKHKGEGWSLRNNGSNGKPNGDLIRYHPGGGRHGSTPYWTVSSSKGGKIRIPDVTQ